MEFFRHLKNEESRELSAAGFVTNQAGGSITGSFVGVKVSYGFGTITNAGAITGSISAPTLD